jgi:hypothetical protein
MRTRAADIMRFLDPDGEVEDVALEQRPEG